MTTTMNERAMLAHDTGSQQDAEAATASYAATLTATQLKALAAEYGRMALAGITTTRTRKS